MKTKTILNTLGSIVLTLCLTAGLASAVGEAWKLVSVKATVEKVDLQKRELTVKGPEGNVRTLTVDKQVKRLNEIEPGDEIKVDYYVSIAMELREPTAEEKDQPLTVLEGTAKAPPNTSPAAGGLRQIRAVVDVVAVDHSTEMVMLKGPLGNTLAVRVADSNRLKTVKKGDTVVVTYTEALAVSLEKMK